MFASARRRMRSLNARNIGLCALLLLLTTMLFLFPQSAEADGGAAPSPTPTSTLAATSFPTPTGEVSDQGVLITDIPIEVPVLASTSEFIGQNAPLPPSDTTATTEASRSTLSCWPLAVGLVIVLAILAFFRLQGRGSSG
jgi:hypothetical protein